MHIEDFLQLCRSTIEAYQPLIDFCNATFNQANPRVYLGTFPRLPARIEQGPVILVETGAYTVSASQPGKLLTPAFALFFRKEGRQDRVMQGIIVREQMFRLILEAIQTMDTQILDVAAEPEYMVEYPDYAMYWSMTFRLDPSDSLDDIEGGAWPES